MKFWRNWAIATALTATTALLGAGCSNDKPGTTDTGTAADVDEGDTEPGGDSATNLDSGNPDSGAKADAADTGTAGPDGDAGSSGGPDGDAGTGTGDGVVLADAASADGSVEPDVIGTDSGPPKPKLPLPECAGGVAANCASKCDINKICVAGVTYLNDCDAIAKLKAYDWPTGYEDKIKKGACPECADCATIDIKCNLQNGANVCVMCDNGKCAEGTVPCTKNADCAHAFDVCATLTSGAKVTVDMVCKTKCMKDLAKDVGVNPTVGACKSSCSQPEPAGGGCSMGKYQPVCAKEDGKTYASTCAMKNCEKQGCYAVGSAAKSDLCEYGKLTKECDGECFAEASKVTAQAANCPKDCNAVCGILPTGKGQSFRNACLATNAGAKVGDCTGVSATPSDKCSAGELYNGKGCCPDVDYTNVTPICASHPADKAGDPDVWVTFRSKYEYDCLTAGDAGKWAPQYDGPCICNCSQQGPAVCGDDGLTYVNACQAKCYNPDKPGFTFSFKKGACP